MTYVLKARYENGLFKPLVPISGEIDEGQEVQIVVDTDHGTDIIGLATSVYDGLSVKDVEEIERISLDRSHFFDRPAA